MENTEHSNTPEEPILQYCEYCESYHDKKALAEGGICPLKPTDEQPRDLKTEIEHMQEVINHLRRILYGDC